MASELSALYQLADTNRKLTKVLGGDMRGMYYRYNKAPLVEHCIHLSTRLLAEPCNRLADGTATTAAGTLTWARGDRLNYRLEKRGAAMLLHLDYKRGEDELSYAILLTFTRPNYGGRRWWLTCPLSVNGRHCGRRVGKLWLAGKYFGCRHCYGLTYLSTREDQLDRHSEAQRAIVKRLGGDPERGIFQRLPEKPPRMHWTTYDRLVERYRAHERRVLRAFSANVASLGIEPIPEPPSREELTQRILERWRVEREEQAELERYREEQRQAARYPTLGKVAERAGVPYAFALEAQRAGLVRADKGRGTRRRRYRAKLAAWLEKLYVLNQSGYSFEELHAWSARRWQPGNEDERRFPRGFAER